MLGAEPSLIVAPDGLGMVSESLISDKASLFCLLKACAAAIALLDEDARSLW